MTGGASIAAASSFEVHINRGKAGLAAGRNRAAELATGDVLAGFDADVAAAPDYLERLALGFTAHPQIAAIGGRLDERNCEAPANLWRAVHMAQHHGDAPVLDPRVLFGATMAIRVDAARRVGGWNERFLTHYEDVDICDRLKAAGASLLYDPRCRAWHLRHDDLGSVLRSFWNWNYHGFEDDLKDVPTWLQGRALLYWNRYQQFRVQDLAHPQLAYITLLLPWAWALRDLSIVRTRDASVGRLTDLVAVAHARAYALTDTIPVPSTRPATGCTSWPSRWTNPRHPRHRFTPRFCTP